MGHGYDSGVVGEQGRVRTARSTGWLATFFICLTIPGASAQTILQSSVSKDGITWTFSQPVQVGQFVNGDYYVVGPVTVTSISPAPTTSAPYLNGSILDLPTSDGKSGFDSRLNDGSDQSFFFNSADRVYPPIALKPGDALVSSISLSSAQYHNVPEVMRSGDMNISPVGSVSILTVLGSAVTADAFRPSYCDRTQAMYYGNNVQRQLLPSLAPPNPSMTPTLAQFEAWYRRPWIDLIPFGLDVPALYMPDYGQHMAYASGIVGLLLELNFPSAQKVNLTNYFVQYGIDLFGCLQAGFGGWPAFGGHRSGRKMPIIFAGVLLNNTAMKNVSALYPDKFGEDMQTLYINKLPPAGTYTQAWQGATVIYGGHYGVHADGTPVSPGIYGPYEQLQPTQWPLASGQALGENYRRCCTSLSWIGEALATRLLGGQGVWNYPAFFDYADRWMNEDDTQAVATIKAETGLDYSSGWERQGQTSGFLQGEFPQPTFIDDMWHAYRNSVTSTLSPPTNVVVSVK